MEIYGRVRRAVLVEGRSQRAVAREFGLSRTTVQKMLRYAVPPGYQRQQAIKRPKLGPWVGVIDAILEEDKHRPAKQQHTAKRIFERLREEHGFPIRASVVSVHDSLHSFEKISGNECLVLAAVGDTTGKTHIALALGLAACQRGHRVRFTTAAR